MTLELIGLALLAAIAVGIILQDAYKDRKQGKRNKFESKGR